MGNAYRLGLNLKYGIENHKEELIKTIRQSRETLDLVCLNLGTTLSVGFLEYRSNKIIDEVDDFLRLGGKLRLLFYSDRLDYPLSLDLFKMISNYGGNEIRTLPGKVKFCYLISDNRDVIVQSKGKDFYVFKDNKKIANQYLERFEKMFKISKPFLITV